MPNAPTQRKGGVNFATQDTKREATAATEPPRASKEKGAVDLVTLGCDTPTPKLSAMHPRLESAELALQGGRSANGARRLRNLR